MKTRSLIPAALTVLALCALPALRLAAADATPTGKPVLELGMDGATVIQLYGRPAEIQPMKNTDGKAEKWIYRRKAREYTTQTASGVTMIPAFIGNTGTGSPMIADTPILDFKVKFVTVYQVTALLMVEGKLTVGKQWLEQEEKFTN